MTLVEMESRVKKIKELQVTLERLNFLSKIEYFQGIDYYITQSNSKDILEQHRLYDSKLLKELINLDLLKCMTLKKIKEVEEEIKQLEA
jgi:hypothetical protein